MILSELSTPSRAAIDRETESRSTSDGLGANHNCSPDAAEKSDSQMTKSHEVLETSVRDGGEGVLF